MKKIMIVAIVVLTILGLKSCITDEKVVEAKDIKTFEASVIQPFKGIRWQDQHKQTTTIPPTTTTTVKKIATTTTTHHHPPTTTSVKPYVTPTTTATVPYVAPTGGCHDWITQAGITDHANAYWLIMKESGCRVNATNSSSGAYGIPQALPGSKMASHGADWRTNPITQLRWMQSYVFARYGSWSNAVASFKAKGWY